LSPVIVPLTAGPAGRGTGINDLRLESCFSCAGSGRPGQMPAPRAPGGL